jgi:hypothetical protein
MADSQCHSCSESQPACVTYGVPPQTLPSVLLYLLHFLNASSTVNTRRPAPGRAPVHWSLQRRQSQYLPKRSR